MAQAETTAETAEVTDEATGEATGEAGLADATPAPVKRSRTKRLAIAGVALVAALGSGGYLAMPTVLAMMAPGAQATAEAKAPSEAGTIDLAASAAEGEGSEAALPTALAVTKLVMPMASASDYQIVSIFDGEAFLATSRSVIRVKVGSTAPGLGDILAIEASDTGGIVTGTLATLKTS